MRISILQPRSPIPVIGAGVLATLVIVAVAMYVRASADATRIKTALFAPDEIVSTVARDMRSTDAAEQVLNEGKADFEDGTWYITVGGAQFRMSQRTRIVVPDNAAAVDLEFVDRPTAKQR